MVEPAELRTDRLLLRPRVPSDAALVRALWEERDPRVPAHRRPDAGGWPGVADLESAIIASRWAEDRFWMLVPLGETRPVGWCGLLGLDITGSPRTASLGYELGTRAWGNGYATEAARAVVEEAGRLRLDRLSATVWDWNLASRRVLAKLGFKERGVDRHGPHGDSLLTELDVSRQN